MKAYEFPLAVGADGSVRIPDAVAKAIAPNQRGKLILLVGEDDEVLDGSWQATATEQFVKGYAEVDSAYDRI